MSNIDHSGDCAHSETSGRELLEDLEQKCCNTMSSIVKGPYYDKMTHSYKLKDPRG